MSNLEDLRARMEAAKLAGPPDVHRMEPGDYIVGRFVSLTPTDTKLGECLMLSLVREDNGERVKLICTTSLRQQVRGLNPRPGDLLGVLYHGPAPTAGGRTVNVYEVMMGASE